MKYEGLLELKKKEEEAKAATKAGMDEIVGHLSEFIRGFNTEVASCGLSFGMADQKASIHPSETGLQLDFMIRMKPHGEDPKKFGVVRLSHLNAGEKKYVRAQVNHRGNEALQDDQFAPRLVEYFQGELGTFDVEVIQ